MRHKHRSYIAATLPQCYFVATMLPRCYFVVVMLLCCGNVAAMLLQYNCNKLCCIE